MKIICKDKVIDLSKFETVQYRESLLGASEGYPVEAIRNEVSGGIFSGITKVTQEIIRFEREDSAKELTRAIAERWGEGAESFDIAEWIK